MEKIEQSAPDAIKIASKIANTAPVPYQQATFQTILQLLLSSHPDKSSPRNKTKHPEASRPTILSLSYSWSDTKIAQLDGLAQYLAVINVGLELGIDGITAREIQQILFEKFRVSKTPNAISMSLMKVVGKLVDRTKDDNEYIYRITKAGIDSLKREEEKIA